MKSYLVDVPVRIKLWIRPDCQKKQFEIIRKARPSILFIVSDGGRNEKEWAAIRQNRKLYDEGVDWNCTIYRLYLEENRGLYKSGVEFNNLVWSKVDRCILLEDDILPSVSYFSYCAELLERYKDDLRINVICGMNHCGVSKNVSSDYFFSRQGAIWGVAMWRRTYETFFRYEFKNDLYVMDNLKGLMNKNHDIWRRTKGYAKDKLFDGHMAGSEFFIELTVYAQHQLQIVPKYNLISNIGCGVDSVHADEYKLLSKGERRCFNAPVFELEWPLKHPEYVFPDEKYEKKRNRIMAYNKPAILFYRKLERLFRLLKAGRMGYVMRKLRFKIMRRVEYER